MTDRNGMPQDIFVRNLSCFGIGAELELEIVSEEMRRQVTAQVLETHWEVRRLHKVVTPHADASRLRRV